jgi:PST family polysaccharide transporter
LVTIAGSLTALAADAVVTREVIANPRVSNIVLGSQFVLRALGSILAVAVVFIVSSVHHETSEKSMVIVAAASLLFAPFEGIAIWFQAEQRPKAAVLSKTIAFLTASFIRLLLVLSGASVIAFATLFSVEAALSAAALVVAYHTYGERIGDWKASMPSITKLFHDSWPLLFAGISSILYMRLDVVMLNEMHGAYETGIYGAATRISEAWHFVPMALMGALQPVLLRTKRDHHALFVNRLETLYVCTAWVSLVVAIIISLISTLMINVLFGQEYQRAGSVLAMHTWSAVAIYVGVVSSQYLLAENLLKIQMFRTMLGLATNIALNLALIPRYGAQGAAASTVVSSFVATFSLALFESTRSQATSMIRAFSPFRAMRLLRSPRSIWMQ